MAKQFFSSKKIFILLLIILTITVVAVVVMSMQKKSVIQKNNTSTGLFSAKDSSLEGNNEELVKNYQKSVSIILEKYNVKKNQMPVSADLSDEQAQEWNKLAEVIRDDLLDLHVPGNYKDLHLELVFNFNSLARGLAEDNPDLIKRSQMEIDQLFIDYSWLKK